MEAKFIEGDLDNHMVDILEKGNKEMNEKYKAAPPSKDVKKTGRANISSQLE